MISITKKFPYQDEISALSAEFFARNNEVVSSEGISFVAIGIHSTFLTSRGIRSVRRTSGDGATLMREARNDGEGDRGCPR